MNGYISKRTNASQSIDFEEIKTIISFEDKRPIIEEKRKIELVDYSLASKWLKELGINNDPFSSNLDVESVIREGNLSKETIGRITVKRIRTKDSRFMSLLNQISEYLGHEDKLEQSDFIFVFGGKNLGRIKKAVQLWKDRYAPKIWISGGHPIYQVYEPEALTFRKWAVDNGVPENCIYIEPNSLTIADNIKRSLNLMDELRIHPHKLILVMSWYAQKRAWMMAEKYLPAGSSLINKNGEMNYGDQLSKTKWFETEYGVNIIFNEFFKMRINDSLLKEKLV